MKRIFGSRKTQSLLTVSIFLVTLALIAGMVGCGPTPFQINDWYDLDAIRGNLDGSYILMNDLDSTTPGYEELAGPAANGGKGWQPIGGIHAHFTGTFDGHGHEIHDLFINRPDELGVALFVSVQSSGIIKDVGVVNVIITGDASVGSLVAINGGNVSNSYFSGDVTGVSFVGGLVGSNQVGVNYDGTVSDSYSTGNVTGDSWVGGLLGGNQGTVSYSYSTGSVTGNEIVGGLVGDNEGTLRNCYSIASVTGYGGVGGLAGYSVGTVSNSYSSGNVIGNSSVGGLVAGNGLDGTVSNCYSTGSVTGEDGVGGLVGWNSDTVDNSYSTGNVTGNSNVGGLVGGNYEGTVSNSFWDTQTSGQTTSDGGTGKNTTAMQDIDTFSGATWNITAVADPSIRNPPYIWNIVNNVTYPFLSWEP
jgi:hypothetical protein